MRRALGSLLLTAALTLSILAGAAGCGDSSGSGTGSDRTPASTSGTPSDGASPGSRPPRTVALLSQSNAGGQVDPSPTLLDGPAAVTSFAEQFNDGNLKTRLSRTVDRADPGAGRALVAAVVSIGCDVPPGVEVEHTGGELRITARPVPSPRQECFVPVTTVAVVAVDSALA